MVKTRVHDLAAEFGVPPEQLLGMLKDMNIFVRSHLSALENDQVSAIRVRWEREKRKSAEEPAAKKGRRKAVKAAEPAPQPVEARPAKRRRTAAEVAVAEAQAQSERAAELAALELERPPVHEVEETVPAQSLEERARALFKDLPPAPAEPYDEAAAAVTDEPAAGQPVDSAAAPAPPRRVTPGEAPPRAPFIPPRIQRPPASPRGPKPVFSSSAPAAPGRPGAPSRPGQPAPPRTFGPDAEKGGGRKKGKKGKRSSVDQDAVQANILRTLQGMKGGAGRKGRRPDEPSFRDLQAGRLAEEREKEKTRIRVNEFISVSELAAAMKVPATQIVQFAFKELGLMVTVNQRLDFDQIELIASAFGFEAVREDEYAAQAE
ncbi:MAG TPA: translation initiation factor IF-2 N-terminal domain-containing protein, partial [Gemmatimonadales bacterium]|nr:translation initiation factor IF-2 N-terminal domain-containing protein [Gemmatimonadales bacterium]